MGQSICPPIELGITEPGFLEYDRCGLGAALHLRFEPPRNRASLNTTRVAVPFHEDSPPFFRAQQVDLPDRSVYVVRNCFEQPDHVSTDPLHHLALEQVRAVLQPQVQPFSRHGCQA